MIGDRDQLVLLSGILLPHASQEQIMSLKHMVLEGHITQKCICKSPSNSVWISEMSSCVVHSSSVSTLSESGSQWIQTTPHECCVRRKYTEYTRDGMPVHRRTRCTHIYIHIDSMGQISVAYVHVFGRRVSPEKIHTHRE